MQLPTSDMKRLFGLLNEELAAESVVGELYVVGGAVMCLVMNARPSTRDVDTFFKPASVVRQAAARAGERAGVGEWLNDAVKGYLSDKGEFGTFLQLSNLKVFCARTDYLLAMKCLAMRIGEEFHDEEDVRYLLRSLNIGSYDEACEVIGRFYPLDRYPQKTLYALEELLGGSGK